LNESWALAQKVAGVKIDAKYGPRAPATVRDSQADTTLAVAELGHAPKFSFEEGLGKTLEWYRQSQMGASVQSFGLCPTGNHRCRFLLESASCQKVMDARKTDIPF
jgi:hypothetical protein